MIKMELLHILSISCAFFMVVRGHDSMALTFELADNDKQCFYQKYKQAKKLTLAFEVIRGGRSDVDFVIESPNGLKVYSEKKRKKDVVNFESSFGIYSFCFSNEFSTISHKVIYFELRPEGHESLADKSGQKKPSANTQIEETMDHINRNAGFIKHVQNNFRIMEARGRHVAENLGARVHVWSIGEAIVILFMGMGQVFVLKRFFSHIRPPGSEKKIVESLPTQSLTA